jgi:hypothetical protein
MAEHPNVTIETTFVGSSLFNPTLLPALNAGEGPDIWMGGTGPGQPAAIVAAGHALDLTPYFCEMGWNETIPDTIVNYTSSGGKLWAVGDSVETTVMFYNTEIFAENGIEVPRHLGRPDDRLRHPEPGRLRDADRPRRRRQVADLALAVDALGPLRRSRGRRQRHVRRRPLGRGALRPGVGKAEGARRRRLLRPQPPRRAPGRRRRPVLAGRRADGLHRPLDHRRRGPRPRRRDRQVQRLRGAVAG